MNLPVLNHIISTVLDENDKGEAKAISTLCRGRTKCAGDSRQAKAAKFIRSGHSLKAIEER